MRPVAERCRYRRGVRGNIEPRASLPAPSQHLPPPSWKVAEKTDALVAPRFGHSRRPGPGASPTRTACIAVQLPKSGAVGPWRGNFPNLKEEGGDADALAD